MAYAQSILVSFEQATKLATGVKGRTKTLWIGNPHTQCKLGNSKFVCFCSMDIDADIDVNVRVYIIHGLQNSEWRKRT